MTESPLPQKGDSPPAPACCLSLITVLGKGNYAEGRYRLGRITSQPTCYAPTAILDIHRELGFHQVRVHVLLTPEAKNMHLDCFSRAATSALPGCELIPVEIPTGRDEGQMWHIFETVATCLETEAERLQSISGHEPASPIVLDVTHGFRSIPLIAVAALRFAIETDTLPAVRILYGAWEARDSDGVIPIFDLTVMTQMDRWARAVADFERRFDTETLTLLTAEHRHVVKTQGTDPDNLRELGHSIRAGLPLETGLAAIRLANSRLADKLRRVAPPAERLTNALEHTLALLMPTTRLPGRIRKCGLVLDQEELVRESRLIQLVAARFELGAAYRMAREWVVNRVLLASGPAYASRWLDRQVRVEAEHALTRKYIRPEDYEVLPDEKLMPLRSIFTARNNLAHAGFTPSELRPDSLRQEFEEAWRKVGDLPDDLFRLLPMDQGAEGLSEAPKA